MQVVVLFYEFFKLQDTRGEKEIQTSRPIGGFVRIVVLYSLTWSSYGVSHCSREIGGP